MIFCSHEFKVALYVCSSHTDDDINRICHAKSPMALFSMFMYIMHGTFAIPECESTLHKNLTDIQV